MGTTLTGTTPQDTYDSLIKVTDNGPISGTLKALSDGLGNDSTLSLSTTAASIAGTLAVSGNATFDTDTLFVDAANNRVGIGLISPSTKLHTYIADGVNDNSLRIQNGSNGYASSIFLVGNSDSGSIYNFISSSTNGGTEHWRLGGGAATSTLAISTAGTERVRITSTGVLELAQGQIKFPATQVASADPNTLDDYEEGTFTPTLTGATNPTVTYVATNTGGIYTKVGNKVSISFEVRFTALSGGSGFVAISGLPFARRTTLQPDSDHAVIQTFGATISGKYLTGVVGSGNSFIAIGNTNSAAATTDLDISDLPTASLCFIRGSVTYFV